MEQQNEAEYQSWKRPDEVMRQHRLKLKQRALQARITRSEQSQPSKSGDSILVGSLLHDLHSSNPEKRTNPFKRSDAKRFKAEKVNDVSSDSTLFVILSERQKTRENEAESDTSFQSFLGKDDENEVPLQFQNTAIPVDWSLKTKIRLISPNPFPWSQKLRTCEEASGITGYVRCLDTGQSDKSEDELESRQSLDTSPNARFHQCGLYWQHPALPWLPLFPRARGESDAATTPGLPPMTLDPMIKESLHQEWCESFRSLFQLVRARQCPFFYLCANAFTCLFRAAGVAGVPEMHALLTPTTRGLRASLKEEDVVFSMPLKKSHERKSSQNRSSDEGYHTLEEAGIGGSKRNTSPRLPESRDPKARLKTSTIAADVLREEEEEEEEEEASEWLERMGVTEAEIKRMESEQAKHVIDSERDIDRKPESLVYVEGVEAQALFNFLMDCRSCVAPTGPLAGVPPTLLSPVAFRGATLGALKVRHSVVKVEGESYHSVELRGPILPAALHSLSGLLCSSPSSSTRFSATFAGVNSTRAFSHATGNPHTSLESKDTESSVSASVFEKESLSDCGLFPNILESFCKSSNSFVLENLKFSDSLYSWSLS